MSGITKPHTVSGKRKICILAYSCTPDAGSEEGVGWGWTTGLSAHADICLITRKNNVPDIQKGLESRQINNVKIVGVDLPLWLRFWKRGAKGAMLYHYFWQFVAAKTAAKLNLQQNFDIYHHLNFAVLWQPCWIALKGKTIFGPLDGEGIIPVRFWPVLGTINAIKEILRYVVVLIGKKMDPFVKLTHRKCHTLIFRTRFIHQQFPDIRKMNTAVITDTGLDIPSLRQLKQFAEKKQSTDKIRIIFMGRLIGRKGVPLAIKSFAKAFEHIKNLELICIGEGPEKNRLKTLCRNLGISEHVRFTGKLGREMAWETLAAGDIFLYPSLRDAVATVILEAMAASLPIICLDQTGPAQIQTAKTAILVPQSNIDQTIKDLSNAIILLAKNTELRQQMGQAAQKVISENYNWTSMTKKMLKIYSKIGINIHAE